MISGRPYAAYHLQDFKARYTEAKAAAMHELHKIVMHLCEGKIRGAEGLRYRTLKSGGRVLMDNLID